MSLTNIITKPMLRGTLTGAGPWQTLFAKAGQRIYPFQIGAMVRADSSGTTVSTHGLGEIRQNDYLIVCAETFYGDSPMFVPNLGRVTKVTSDPTVATDDTLTIAPAITVLSNEWLLCIGPDGGANPLSVPLLDGSTINLFADNAGNNANANPYFLTASNGNFRGWVDDGVEACDLLITDDSGGVRMVIPLKQVGPGIVQ